MDNTNTVHVDVRLTDNRARAGFKTTAKAVTPDNAARLAAAKYFECKPSQILLQLQRRGSACRRQSRFYRATLKLPTLGDIDQSLHAHARALGCPVEMLTGTRKGRGDA